MPLRSLNRSSALELEVEDDEPADASAVNEAASPHNLWITGEIGCDRSPAWNSERKLVLPAVEPSVVDDACATVTGVVVAVFGKLDKKAALSTLTGAALATAVVAGVSPTAAIAVRVADELEAAA